MTTADEFLADSKADKFWSRDRYGYRAPDPVTGDMTRYRRASTVSGMVKETWAIQRWEHRRLVQGFATHPELALRVLADYDDDDTLDVVANEAKVYGGSKVAAEMGTALHRIIERHHEGDDLSHLPDEIHRRIAQYDAVLADAGLSPIMAERIVCLPALGIMGQFDVVYVNAGPLGYVGDLKTGADIEIAATEFSIQLGIYTHAEWVITRAGDAWEPMPAVDTDKAFIVHLPSQGDGCTLYEVDTKAGFEAVHHLCEPVRKWRRRTDLVRKVEGAPSAPQPDVEPPTASPVPATESPSTPAVESATTGNGDRASWISGRLQALAGNERARTLIGQRWPDGVTVKPPWTQEAIDSLASMLDDVERTIVAPFGATDPAAAVGLPRPAVAADSPPEWAPSWEIEDTGEAATDEDVTNLANVVAFLDSAQQARLRGLSRDARDQGRPFDAKPMTKRQWACARAALAVASHTKTDDEARNLTHSVLHDLGVPWVESWVVGAVIGSLSIEQAERLTDFADAPF